MSVYTSISQAEAEQFLSKYDVGKFSQLTPIENGAENSNYYLTTDKQSFVLTIFEHININELPYFLAIISRAGQALPVPKPIPDNRGNVIQMIAGKPSVLFPRIPGHHVSPTPIHCTKIGKFLGQFHVTFYDFELTRHNPRPPQKYTQIYKQLAGVLPAKDKVLFIDSLDLLSSRLWASLKILPHSTLHGDLFHDNALLENETLTGVLDFYSAFTGPMLFDIAVTANDWCRTDENHLDPEKLEALLTAYQRIRPFTNEEKEHAYEVFYWAAFRFWVSRLVRWYQPRKGELILTKDPEEFAHLLQFLRNNFNKVFVSVCA